MPETHQRQLVHLFSQVGLEPEIHWVEPAQLPGILRQLYDKGVNVIVVGGGDGTLHTAANFLVDTSIAMGILPLGTFNHFAKDLRIPVEMNAAIRVLSRGIPQAIDVGEVNGHIFLNVASAGIYPYAVRKRNLYQQHLGLPKLPAMGYALLGAFWRLPMLKAWLKIDEKREFVKTPFIFIGNNRYRINPITGIYRQALNEARLSVFYARRVGRLTLIKIAIKTLFGRIMETPELEALIIKAVTLETHHKWLRVAMDGEVTMIQPPLRFSIRQQSLRVIVPQESMI
jgi:diacylglycerol kinase family enzyme